mgnify:CR=1 FL=1|tara:strand:- start:74 stop:415 length:342 start_codon:yes stop_codon:yes gene_type:complete
MKKIKTYNLAEFSSITLILSYFFIKNIFLVLFGIFISIYLINYIFINSFLVKASRFIANDENRKKGKSNTPEKESKYTILKLTDKDSNYKLVERIEELGFIPSLENDDDINIF